MKAEREAARSALKQTTNLTAAERVADFMKDPAPAQVETARVIRGEAKRTAVEPEPAPIIVASAAAAGAAAGAPIPVVTTERSSRRSTSPTVTEDADDIEEMIKGVSVLRVKAEAPATAKLPFDAGRRPSYDDYNLPALHFLNEAPPHSEQADAELLALANRLAEKCKEFNVTGQIKHICPGPVVTTYEFKPDPGVKYSRVVSLVDDLCLALKAESIRIDRMPGKPHVGIEVPEPASRNDLPA